MHHFNMVKFRKVLSFFKVNFPCERLKSLVFRTLKMELKSLIVFAEFIHQLNKVVRVLNERIAEPVLTIWFLKYCFDEPNFDVIIMENIWTWGWCNSFGRTIHLFPLQLKLFPGRQYDRFRNDELFYIVTRIFNSIFSL